MPSDEAGKLISNTKGDKNALEKSLASTTLLCKSPNWPALAKELINNNPETTTVDINFL